MAEGTAGGLEGWKSWHDWTVGDGDVTDGAHHGPYGGCEVWTADEGIWQTCDMHVCAAA